MPKWFDAYPPRLHRSPSTWLRLTRRRPLALASAPSFSCLPALAPLCLLTLSPPCFPFVSSPLLFRFAREPVTEADLVHFDGVCVCEGCSHRLSRVITSLRANARGVDSCGCNAQEIVAGTCIRVCFIFVAFTCSAPQVQHSRGNTQGLTDGDSKTHTPI